MALPRLTDPTTGQQPPPDQLWIQAQRILDQIESVLAPGGGSGLGDPGSNGMLARTLLGVTVARTLTGPAAGLTISNGDGVSGNPTFALANDLAALEGLSGTGVAQRTGTDAWSIARITDDGTVIQIGTSSASTILIGSEVTGSNTSIGGADASGFSADTDVTIIGDYNGVGNASWVYVKDSVQEIELRGLLLVPYAAGVMDVGEVAAPFKSVIIGNAANNSSKLTGTFTANRTLTLPDSSGTLATQAYADALVIGLLDDRGNYDASVNLFPSSGGSGSAGAILKGDLWTISVAGTLGGHAVTAGDVVRALVDTPGQTDANWAITENNLGYVPLNQSLADGKIYIGNGSGIGTAVTPSGDVTISNTGVTAIGALKVTNGMLAGSIAASKLVGTDIATVGTITSGTWQGTVIGSTYGGTGINNAGRTLTISTNSGTLAFGAASKTLTINNSIALSGTDSTVMTFPATNATIARTDAGQTFTGNQTFAGHLFPSVTDTYDIGSSTLLWRKGWLSELDAVLFAQNTISVIGGWLMIAKNEGLIPVGQSVGTGDTTIDFGQAMTANDFVIFRAAGAVEYVQVLTLSSGTRYNVTRNLDGSGANAWPAGSVYVVLGNTTSGRIELNANSTPRISMIKQGATYNAQTELLRIGDLNGWSADYSAETYGVAVGVSTGAWIKIDPTNGVRLGFNTTTNVQVDGSGNASFSGAITAASGTIAGWTIASTKLTSGAVIIASNEDVTASQAHAWFGKSATGYYGVDLRDASNRYIQLIAGNGSLRPYFAAFDGTHFRVAIGELNQAYESDGATNSVGMKIWSSAGTKLVEFSDVQNIISGWTINSTAIQNSGATVMLRGAGNLAFGSTPPTSATVGTGLFLDSTGLYGLASSVQQAIFDATTGKVTFGGGAGSLAADGISITATTSPSDPHSIRWTDSGTTLSRYAVVYNSSIVSVTVNAMSKTGDIAGLAGIGMVAYNDAGDTATFVVNSFGSSNGNGAFAQLYSSKGETAPFGFGIGFSSPNPAYVLDVRWRDTATNTILDLVSLAHNSTGTAAAGLGTAVLFNLESTTTENRNAARIGTLWTTATDASRTSAFVIQTVNNAGSLAEVARFAGNGDFTLTGVIKAGSGPTTLTDATGKILSASLNTVAVAQGGTGITNAPCAHVYNNADITITTGTTTALTFNTERFDTDTIHDTSTNTGRLTCKTAGKYLIIFHALFEANATGWRMFDIRLNGTTAIGDSRFNATATAGIGTGATTSTIYDLAVNDYVEAVVYQDSGGNLKILSIGNQSPEFMMVRLMA